MKILLVGMDEMFLARFTAQSGLQEMQMKCWLERADSCWLLTAFCQDFFSSCGFHFPQLEPIHASLILFLGRAWDAVTDPAIGFLVSKSPRRKYGKLVPW